MGRLVRDVNEAGYDKNYEQYEGQLEMDDFDEKEESYEPWFDKEEDARIFNAMYSTKRNATERLSLWQNQMEWRDIKLVQDSCTEFFQLFGYNTFSTLQEVRSMKKAFIPEFLFK